jgi:hypothetical protein
MSLRYAFPDARLREKFDQLITPQGYLDLPGSSNSSEKSPDEPMVTRLEFEMEVHGIFAHYPSENDKSGFGDVSTVWVEADDGTCGFMKYEKSDDNLSPRFDHLRSRHDTYLKLSQIRRIKVQLPHCEGLRPVAEYKLRMKQMDILLPRFVSGDDL